MIRVKHQKMYTEEHKKDMDFVAIGDHYIGPFFENGRAERAADIIGSYLTPKQKPTPTKLVKVEEPIFDLKAEFESGELYSSDCEGCYTQLKCKKKLYLAGYQDSIYRQVEIDWRDEVKEVYDAVELPVGEQGSLYMGEDWDEQEFIKFCHLVASITEKPEGV
ncbi:hypothetical protein NVP1173O_15 [Vibrio phage 1.173.O._10N.261.55.A11]|nr:hypothetical protein NVP1173O_15 [Vibrio phage 1.173.O._10N.261.55.A11]